MIGTPASPPPPDQTPPDQTPPGREPNGRRTGRPTIRDVAEAAGVSKSLVSLVLQNSPKVSEHKRARVLAAAQRIGYERNLVAQSLSIQTGRTGVVAILVADMANPWLIQVSTHVRLACEEAGQRVLVTPATRTERDTEVLDLAIVELLLSLHVDGVAVIGDAPDRDRFVGLFGDRPCVWAGALTESTGVRISNDNARGMALVVDHLVSRGHRRIAHAGGLGGPEATARRRGYEDAMRRHGLGGQIRVQECTFSELSGRRAALALLSEADHPTAIIAANDLAALGALGAIGAAGLRCPHDVAVTGYDDTDIAASEIVSLTSVRQDAAETGARAARRLLELLAATPEVESAARWPTGASPRPVPAPDQEIITPELVVRRSTGGLDWRPPAPAGR